MTKNDLVRTVAKDLGLTLVDAKSAVDVTLEHICQILYEAGRIELRNFGVFEVKVRAARKARNPRTNTPVAIPPRRVVTFQPGRLLAQTVARQA